MQEEEKELKKEIRCPHCGGALLSATLYCHPRLASYYEDYVHCFVCGREFRKEALITRYVRLLSQEILRDYRKQKQAKSLYL